MRRRLIQLVVLAVLAAGSPLAASVAPDAPEAAAAKRFGNTPLDDVLYWAGREARCGLTQERLAALMLAPAWPETGAPDTLSPSPMTLSRWDNQSSLRAFGGNSFPRAFWHPGVGFWQFDSAGLGAPFTARERIDTYVISAQMARIIADRWCASHDAAYVWQPWHGCSSQGRCLAIYLYIYNGGHLRNLSRDTSTGRTGGMQTRTCRGPGISGSFTCHRVDPSLAQGYNGFAQPSYGPAPITAPFYVYSAGGREYRHWLRSDTGYSRGIWATRPLGQNARTSLTWHSGDTLCDLTVRTGACCPAVTANYSCLATTVNGTYTPASGDFNGDGIGDVLWYAAGAATDRIWFGSVFGQFSSRVITVGGNYDPEVGDFDGDGRDDILWYAAGAGQDFVWYGTRNESFTGQRINASGDWTPVTGDFDRDGRWDVFWYGRGPVEDFVWYGGSRRFTGRPASVAGETFQPFTGDFDGDGRWDVFWYNPGGGTDVIWYGGPSRSFSGQQEPVSGTYVPVAGMFNRGPRTDILWYQPGDASDVVWFGKPGRVFEGRSVDIDATYQPFTGDFTGDGPDDVFFYAPGAAKDVITRGG